MQIDYDDIENWHDSLTKKIDPIIPAPIRSEVASYNAEYIQDSTDHLFRRAPRSDVINAGIDWLKANQVIAYHGTRLTAPETESVKVNGLLPLNGAVRAGRLREALSPHPRWSSVSSNLDAEIKRHTAGERRGRREGQVHLTLSRSGLVNGFNHYLQAGSEFDQCVAEALLGQEGVDFLGAYGKPTLIKVCLPGELALSAAHPFFSAEDMMNRGDMPNIVREFLQAWAYRLHQPSFQTTSLNTDCGLIFFKPVCRQHIIDVETLLDIGHV